MILLKKFSALICAFCCFCNLQYISILQYNFKAKKDNEDPTKQITQQLSQQLGQLWSNVEAFKNDPQIASLFAEANNALVDTVSPDYLFKRLQDFQAQV